MSEDDERVGYKRPPRNTQFKKGQSGNPKGRPKGTKNLKTDLAQELGETVRVREGDREYRVSKQRAVLKAVVAAAVKGNISAASTIIGLYSRFLEGAENEERTKDPSASDRLILEKFLEREIERRITSKKSPVKPKDKETET